MSENSSPSKNRTDTENAMILVVDDQAENIEVLSRILKTNHFRVRAARSGEQALRAAQTDPIPALILLDVLMPEMNGFAVLHRLQENPVTAAIPVIFVTGLGADKDEQHGLGQGAVDYLTKPVRPAVVLARVRLHLELKQARDRLSEENIRLEEKILERTRALETTQNQILQAEKMAALGLLAAGVAHELNNPIGFVTSNLGTLSKYVDDYMQVIEMAQNCLKSVADPSAGKPFEKILMEKDLDYLNQDTRDLLAESKDGMERMRRIVADLRAFSRTDEQVWKRSDLHLGLESTLNLVWNEIKYKAEVIKDYDILPEVNCEPSQINQVFMNLLVNAAHAIESKGKITIVTRKIGDTVVIEISDTGRGIPPENLNRIFEPFFTTKPVGKGTGLGLSLAYGIIQRHQGALTVESTVGVGTTFRIQLPIQGKPPAT